MSPIYYYRRIYYIKEGYDNINFVSKVEYINHSMGPHALPDTYTYTKK